MRRCWIGRLAGLAALAFTAACQSSAGAPPKPIATIEPAAGPKAPRPASAKPAAPPIPIDWAAAPDCLATLRLLQEAALRDRLATAAAPPVSVLVPGAPGFEGWLEPRPLQVVADLPLPVYPRGTAEAEAVPCAIEIQPAQNVRSEHRLVGSESVSSVMQSGVRTEHNPDYDVARADLRHAERNSRTSDVKVMRVGDPMLDLIGVVVGGVLNGFGLFEGRHQVDEALAELADTPRSIERPVYRPYQFERTTLRARKEAVIPLTLHDREHRQVWHADLRLREMREFQVLQGLDPRDRDYEQLQKQSMTREGLEQWAREPPPIHLSKAVAALIEPAAVGAAPAGSGTSPTADSRFESSESASKEPDAMTLDPKASDAKGGLLVQAAASADPGFEDVFDARAKVEASAAPAEKDPGFDASAEALSTDPTTLRAHERVWPVAGRRADAADAHRPAARSTRGADDPRAESVVRIDVSDQTGAGFYVRSDLVLTSAQVLGSASVVDVTTAEGDTVPGLVALKDATHNLALVQVPKPGTALRIDGDAVLEPGGRLVALGPLDAGGMTLVSGVPGGKGYGTGSSLLHLESERPFSGTSAGGAPLLLDDAVVGVLVAGPDGRDHVALPAADVLAFVNRAPIAAQP